MLDFSLQLLAVTPFILSLIILWALTIFYNIKSKKDINPFKMVLHLLGNLGVYVFTLCFFSVAFDVNMVGYFTESTKLPQLLSGIILVSSLLLWVGYFARLFTFTKKTKQL